MKQKISNKPTLVYMMKFIVVHVVTYAVFGIIFMYIDNYFVVFANDPVLKVVMKPTDALSVRLAIPAQIFRGALLALAVYPFRAIVLERRSGWIKLFWLLFVLTGVGAVITGPGSIEGMLYTRFHFNPLIGLPEITVQMIAFSWLFCYWQGATSQK